MFDVKTQFAFRESSFWKRWMTQFVYPWAPLPPRLLAQFVFPLVSSWLGNGRSNFPSCTRTVYYYMFKTGWLITPPTFNGKINYSAWFSLYSATPLLLICYESNHQTFGTPRYNKIYLYLVIYFFLRRNMLAWCLYAMLVAQGLAQVMEILSTKTHKVPQLTSCTQGAHKVRTTNHTG